MGVGGATVLCGHRAQHRGCSSPKHCFQYSSTFMILLIIPRGASTLVGKVRGTAFPAERAAYFPTRGRLSMRGCLRASYIRKSKIPLYQLLIGLLGIRGEVRCGPEDKEKDPRLLDRETCSQIPPHARS